METMLPLLAPSPGQTDGMGGMGGMGYGGMGMGGCECFLSLGIFAPLVRWFGVLWFLDAVVVIRPAQGLGLSIEMRRRRAGK
jgi:hypothetical protein